MFGGIKSGIYRRVKNIVAKELGKVESRLPSVELGQQYFHNLKVLNNRESLLKELPKDGIVAELGVDKGDFSQKIIEICRPQKLHLIDYWGTERYHAGLKDRVETRFSSQIQEGSVLIHRELSTEAANRFPVGYFDWIYIDTDHSYETTRDELLLYRDKILPGGIIAGHDFVKGNMLREIRYGVIEAAYEFCYKENWEFVFLTMEIDNSPSFAIRRISGNA